MKLAWSDSIDNLDWRELAALYRAAPLGNKLPATLQVAFTNSMFRCFVRENGVLVGVGRALADGTEIVARLQSPASGEPGLAEGQGVGIRFAEGAVQRVED